MNSQLAGTSGGTSGGFVNAVRGLKPATVAGLVLVPLGAWAALEPFLVGGWSSDWSASRIMLTVVPGTAVLLGGLIMLTGHRRAVTVGGGLALAAGLWLIAAPVIYAVTVGTELGTLSGGESVRMLQWMPFFFGAGALVSLVSAYGLGLLAPLEFDEVLEPEPAQKRVRVPLPPERPRRQRVAREPAPLRERTRTRAN
jgi:hypothetical protein